jgi:hypothetical protein
MAIKLKPQTGELEVQYKGQRVMLYSFGARQAKPYVKELYDFRGENVLRDAPPDHLHHHGLMYAVWVNGINFWEEKDSPGIERLVEIPLYVVDQGDMGIPRARFIQLIHWLPPAKKSAKQTLAHALLIEQRTLTLTVDERTQEVALAWESEFEVGPKIGKVKLSGDNYDGLGLRLAEAFNPTAKFQNSAGLPYKGANTQDVISAQWTSVSGALGGQDVMLVLFGNTNNAHGDAKFFTMRDPFAYLTATQGLDKEPLEYSSGAKFKLNYLLAVYTQNQPRDFIQQRYERWQSQK